MKKWGIWILTIILAIVLCLWSACGVAGTEENLQADDEIGQISFFQIGGIGVDASEGLQEWKTGTEMTNAAQQLLREKYGKDFCCEQYLYYEEFSLLMKLEAYPADNPELRFALDVQGADSLSLWWDDYYNELYREEIEKYIYPAVEPYGIRQEQFFADIYSMVTTPEISEKTFYRKTMGIYFSVSEKEAEELQTVMPEVIRQIYDKTRSEADFWVYVCQEGMTGAKDFDALRVWKSYDVRYVSGSFSKEEEPGESLEIRCHGKQGEKAEQWTISVPQ